MSTITMRQTQIQRPTSVVPLRGNGRAGTVIQIPRPPLPLTRSYSKSEKGWGECGIGMTSLILATIFGIGAWVGMNMQYNQGAKSLKLSV
jgi:hypothetical protein